MGNNAVYEVNRLQYLGYVEYNKRSFEDFVWMVEVKRSILYNKLMLRLNGKLYKAVVRPINMTTK